MNHKKYDLNKLQDFADFNGISVIISYWEGSNELSVEVSSAAPSENFYMKRVPNLDFFIEKWKEKMEQNNGN